MLAILVCAATIAHVCIGLGPVYYSRLLRRSEIAASRLKAWLKRKTGRAGGAGAVGGVGGGAGGEGAITIGSPSASDEDEEEEEEDEDEEGEEDEDEENVEEEEEGIGSSRRGIEGDQAGVKRRKRCCCCWRQKGGRGKSSMKGGRGAAIRPNGGGQSNTKTKTTTNKEKKKKKKVKVKKKAGGKAANSDGAVDPITGYFLSAKDVENDPMARALVRAMQMETEIQELRVANDHLRTSVKLMRSLSNEQVHT